MLLTSSVGFILVLLSHCPAPVSTEGAIVLANAHLLPQGGYERLGNSNEKGTRKRVSELNARCVVLYRIALAYGHALPQSRMLKTFAQLPSNSRELTSFCKKKTTSKQKIVAFEDLFLGQSYLDRI